MQLNRLNQRQLTMTDVLAKQEITESNVRSYPRRIPIALKKALGCIVTDIDGKDYYDCLAGAGTLALGHNHPVILEAIREVIENGLPLHTLDLTTPVKQKFIDDVLASLPTYFEESVVQFCGPTGADAVEAAIKLAKIVTGREGIFSFQGGYHGMTHGALAVTGNLDAKRNIRSLMPNVHFLPYPYHYRCPFGLGGDQGIQANLHYLENLLSDPESGVVKPAAIILEIIQGEGGVIPAPITWLQQLRKITERYDILLIVDEVQTGIGRTGSLFAFEVANIAPDILILSKAIGGSFPLSLLVFPKRLDQWNAGQHTGTFRGNQMAMAAGSATLQFIREKKILEHVNKVGHLLKTNLWRIQHNYPCIGEVRGRGLMLGVEIVNPELIPNHLGNYPYDGARARTIQQHCLANGLIIEVGGRFGSTLRFLPPLIISEDEIKTVTDRFAAAIQASY